MKKIIITLLLVVITLPIFAELVEATYNAKFTKDVAVGYINGAEVEDVVVHLESSKQGYTTTYTSGIFAGASSVTHTWVKIKVTDRNTKKKIYSKKFKRSCLYIFDGGKTIKVGQGNATTEVDLSKGSTGWYLEIDENGDL